jgi:hypothetical protein
MLQPSSKRISPSVRLQILQAEQNFDHLALLRVDEIKRSAPYCADGALGGARVSSGFSAFALRSLVLVAAHASNHVVKMLISWHERERTRAAAVNDVRDCAVNATFCEALLAVLLGHPDAASGATDGAAGSTTTAAPRGAPCEPIVLDVLLERAFEFFLMQKEKRQEVARRRLAALNGRTEEELWRAVLHALSRHRFESLSNKLLVQLEAAGGGGGGRRRGGVGKGVEAMCCALRGLHVPSGAGGADADTTGAGVKEAYSFLHSLWNRVLQSKQYRPIHPAVCDALGTALLGDALREATLQPADPAAVSTAELDVTLASPRPFAAAASDYGFRQSDGASLHAELLGELQKEVAKWCAREDRRRPRPSLRVLVGAARDRPRLPRPRHLAPRPRRPRRTRAPRGHPPRAPEEAALLPVARPRPADRRTPMPRGAAPLPPPPPPPHAPSPPTSHFPRHRCCSPCGCSSSCSTATPMKPRNC